MNVEYDCKRDGIWGKYDPDCVPKRMKEFYERRNYEKKEREERKAWDKDT
jgi:hypothetical protein